MGDSEAAVSVVIPVRNGAATVGQCIEGLLRQSHAVREIIALDSGSTDGTREILASYAQVRVIDVDPASFDHGETRNVGVREATSEWVVLTVQDAVAADDQWIARLLDGITDSAVVGVCGSQVVPHRKSTNPLEWFRPQSEPVIERIQYSSVADFDRLSAREKLRVCSWDNVTALYARSALLEVPFQPTIYGEDAVWARDALRRGHALVYNWAARVNHYHHQSSDFAFSRTIAAAHMRFTTFGYLHAVPERIRPAFRSAYRLIREPSVGWRERARWFRMDLEARAATRRAVVAYANAVKSGTHDQLYSTYCSRPPVPARSAVIE